MRTILDFDTLSDMQNVIVCVVPKENEKHYNLLPYFLPKMRIPFIKVSTRYPDVLRGMEYDPEDIKEPFMVWRINGEWVSIIKRTSLKIIKDMEEHYYKQIVL